MNVFRTVEGAAVGGVRRWLMAEGTAVLALSVLMYWRLGMNWWLFAGLLLVPDLSMLGYLMGAKVGAACYDLVHSYTLPLILLGAGVLEHRAGVIAGGLIWTAHIGIDRMLGYGLKYEAGFARTHLGVLGKARTEE